MHWREISFDFFFQISWKYLFLCCENVSVQYWLYPNFSMPLCYWERLCKLLTVKKKTADNIWFPFPRNPTRKIASSPKIQDTNFFSHVFFLNCFIVCYLSVWKKKTFLRNFSQEWYCVKEGFSQRRKKIRRNFLPTSEFFYCLFQLNNCYLSVFVGKGETERSRHKLLLYLEGKCKKRGKRFCNEYSSWRACLYKPFGS